MTITRLPKQPGSSSVNAYAYWGEREGRSVACSQHRDSDPLDRSNFHIISTDILTMPDDATSPDDGLSDATIESNGHFAVGWTKVLLVRPGSSAERRALYWANELENYPVASEDHFTTLEWEEEWCLRCESAMREEHPTVRCGKFRGESDIENILYAWNRRLERNREAVSWLT